MRSKVLIIVVALVLGGAAAVVAANYLSSARTDIAAANEPIGVLVANEDLPRGMSAEELVKRKLVSVQQVPRRFVAADAVSSQRAIAEQVLAVPVSAGEQLTKTRFQFPAEAGLSYSVPENFVACTVPVDEVSGVGGLLKPGDQVTVYATLKPDSMPKSAYTAVIVPSSKVLAVGAVVAAESSSDTKKENSSGGVLGGGSGAQGGPAYRSVTLAVPPTLAEKAIFASQVGEIHLTLLPPTAGDIAPLKPVSFTNVAK
jgi:pilus assembly protein CpaB